MDLKTKLTISNYKVRFFTKTKLIPQKIYYDSVKVLIFASGVKEDGSWINATGIKTFEKIQLVKSFVQRCLECVIIEEKIDSIFLSRKCKSKYNMASLLKNCQAYSDLFRIVYDNENNGSVIYLLPHLKGMPSLNLFYTGSVTSMGSNCIEHVNLIHSVVRHVYEET